MIKTRAVEVTDEPVRVDQTGVDEGSSGESVAVLNEGADTAYLGGSDVTDANGFPVPVNGQVAFDLQQEEALYGVCATGETATLRVIEQGV